MPSRSHAVLAYGLGYGLGLGDIWSGRRVHQFDQQYGRKLTDLWSSRRAHHFDEWCRRNTLLVPVHHFDRSLRDRPHVF